MSKWPGGANAQSTTFGSLTRSQLMSRVHSRGNKTTEIRVAKLLRERKITGWRRHASVFGRPDFVWRPSKVALFVDGCFWHGHNCGRNLQPKTNEKLWAEKIKKNQVRDRKNTRALKSIGWIVIRVWECELAKHPNRVSSRISAALRKR